MHGATIKMVNAHIFVYCLNKYRMLQKESAILRKNVP